MILQQVSKRLSVPYNFTNLSNILALFLGVILVGISLYDNNIIAQILFLVAGALIFSYGITNFSYFFRSSSLDHTGYEGTEQLLRHLSGIAMLTDRNGVVLSVTPEAKKIIQPGKKINLVFDTLRTDIEGAVYRLLRHARIKENSAETLYLKNSSCEMSVRTMLFSADTTLWTIKPVNQANVTFFNMLDNMHLAVVCYNTKNKSSYYNTVFPKVFGITDVLNAKESEVDFAKIQTDNLFTQPIEVGENTLALHNRNECRVTLKEVAVQDEWIAYAVLPVQDTIITAHSEDSVSKFVDYCPVGAIIMDAEGKIIHANRAALDIIDTPALAGQTLEMFSQDDDYKVIRQTLKHISCSSASMRTIQFQTRPDAHSKTRYLQMFVRKIPVSDSSCMMGILIDKTKIKDLETQFAQSQKMQAVGKLAGGVAHDFNNLLTAISGHCDLLLLRHQTGDADFSDLIQIQQNSNRAANLVRQLLAFSRQQTLTPKILNLTDVLADFRHLLDRLLGEKINVKMQQQPDLWPVKADQGQLEQVVMNLAVNAQDAMPNGGTLTILTQNITIERTKKRDGVQVPEGQYVNIQVTDTGTGMPEHIRTKVFEPFFTTKDIGKGTGLGLSTVYGIIKQTGGFVFVESVDQKGTSFDILLPRAEITPEDVLQKAAIENRVEAKRDLTGQGTILLVEDEDSVRAFAARALETRGYIVLAVDSGEEALEVLHARNFDIDLMVSDVVMPEMDGPTLVQKVRQIRPDIKVIFMSGYAEEAFRKNLNSDEKFGFIAKPFSLKKLSTIVKDTLSETV